MSDSTHAGANQRSDTRALRVGGAAAIAVTIALTTFGGFVLNAGLYSQVATYCGIAREINTFGSAALFFVLFVVAVRWPSLLDKRIMTVGALGCLATAAVVLELAVRFADPAATVVGLLFSTAGKTWAAALIACSLGSLGSAKEAAVAAAGGIALGGIVAMLAPTPNWQIAIALHVAFPVLVVALLYRRSSDVLDAVRRGAPPFDLEVANPESFFAPTHALFLCAFLFSVASGYALTINEVGHAPVTSDFSALLTVALALWAIFGRDGDKEDTLFSCAVLLVIAGFLLAPFTFSTGLPSANTLLRCGNDGFSMLVWMVIAAVGRRNVFALLPTFALIRACGALGTNLGAIAGHTSNGFVGANQQAAELIAAVALFLFVALLWVGFRKFSFSGTIRGMAGVAEGTSAAGKETAEGVAVKADAHVASTEAADSPGQSSEDQAIPQRSHTPSIEECCAVLGAQHGLTERETEIFSMLARGRNGTFIMEHYVISRNTVKSHIKHIYAKLDVHSQQELIDLVESEATNHAGILRDATTYRAGKLETFTLDEVKTHYGLDK
ncbi:MULTISPECIES: helix-turn-helix transcriptional regulator [Gordonibacter]|uniref:Helix-turn-helix transcriptional regulator n=1 Tax=Gordonibacter faecis TaxID=3047475 RepID=A0ABT7DPH3_9ACTN|nr:helix-turn-helix transcriptional regulator [Gordonibacter sp. KGMB12511]MDJ1651449.1 helix-turn-helix transcriptional regulator [Gordonibacter sp. KGMB12511]